MNCRIVYRLIWIPSLAALVFLLGFQAKVTPGEAKVEALAPFVSTGKLISLNAPANWKAKETKSRSGAEIKFSPGSGVVFSVACDEAIGSLLAATQKLEASTQGSSGVPGSPNGTGNPQGTGMPNGSSASGSAMPPGTEGIPGFSNTDGKRKSSLETLHAAQAEMIEDAQKDFRDGRARKVQVAGFPALASECSFAAVKGITATDVVGERVTFLSQDRAYLILYRCPKDQKDKMLPIFRQMVDSLRINEQGGQ